MKGASDQPPSPRGGRDLTREPSRFALFQAIRLLEVRAGGPRLGREGPATEETVRLRPDTSLAFPAADVSGVEALDRTEAGLLRYRVTATFLGLYGSSSPLPTHYAESLAQSDPGRNRVRDFLDLFHHRLFSLLYRSWARHRYVVEFVPDGSDDISRRLLAAIGLDREVTEPLGIAQVELLRYASLLLGRVRSSRALELLWRGLLGDVPVEITPNVARRVTVPLDQRAALGTQAVSLGVDFVLGREVLDRSGKFRITLGPVGYDLFEDFLPGADGTARLERIVDATSSGAFAYEIEVKLKPEERPPLRLGTPHPRKLGWTSWFPAQEGGATKVESVVFQPAGRP